MASCANASVLVAGYGTSAAAVVHVWDTSLPDDDTGGRGSSTPPPTSPSDATTTGQLKSPSSQEEAPGTVSGAEASVTPADQTDSGSGANASVATTDQTESGSGANASVAPTNQTAGAASIVGTKGKLEGHSGYVRAVDVSADGRTIVSGSDDGTVRTGTERCWTYE